MISASLGSTVDFAKSLDVLKWRLKEIKESGHGAHEIDSEVGKALQTLILMGKTLLKDENDIHVRHALEALSLSVGHVKSYSEVYADLYCLSRSIETLFRASYFYKYPEHKMKSFGEWKAQWAPVITAFPDASLDILEGVDCWALEHNTASVFHMMRVLEHGLKWLADSLEVNFGVQNWQNVLDQIEAKIRERGKTLRSGAEKIERMQFLSEAAKEFHFFKDGWRNHVSHNRGTYDEHQARSVIEHVRAFMIVLARKASAS